jgi:nitronate monooxygenase
LEMPEIEASDDFDFEDQVEAILEARPAVFSFVFGIPDEAILKECRQRGIATMGAATTAEEAEALDAAGVDMLVASGSDAGGHRPSFLREAEASLVGTMSLVAQVRALTAKPVIAAGGIASAAGVQAAMALGADAAQVGTAFLACEESNCPALHREALFQRDARLTMLSRRFTGRLARFVATPLLQRLDCSPHPSVPFPWQATFVRNLKARGLAEGDAGLLPLYAGQAAGLLEHRRAADLVEALSVGYRLTEG